MTLLSHRRRSELSTASPKQLIGAVALFLAIVGAVLVTAPHHSRENRDALLVISAPRELTSEVTTTTTLPPPVPSRPPVGLRGSRPAGGGHCGRSLDQIGADESHNDYSAVNASSGAGGRYQILPSTWRSNGGTGLPQNASPAEQDRIAQKIYAEQGTRPWAASGC